MSRGAATPPTLHLGYPSKISSHQISFTHLVLQLDLPPPQNTHSLDPCSCSQLTVLFVSAPLQGG